MTKDFDIIRQSRSNSNPHILSSSRYLFKCPKSTFWDSTIYTKATEYEIWAASPGSSSPWLAMCKITGELASGRMTEPSLGVLIDRSLIGGVRQTSSENVLFRLQIFEQQIKIQLDLMDGVWYLVFFFAKFTLHKIEPYNRRQFTREQKNLLPFWTQLDHPWFAVFQF